MNDGSLSVNTGAAQAGEPEWLALYRKACALAEDHLPLHDKPQNHCRPGFFLRQRLRRSVKMLERVVALCPRHWPALWMAGMLYRRLGQEQAALECFARSFELKPDQPDVARETALSAMNLGLMSRSIEYTEAALRATPGDPGLLANLALAHLFNQNPAGAKRLADAALVADPSDTVTRAVVQLIDEVVSGRRRCPRGQSEV
jgi:tetratricopeptide (TPR) repeat protein